MINKDQIFALAKKNKINEMTILREYLQIWFLSELYSSNQSKQIFFKGGTAIHLIYKAPRFSEDLDFTVGLGEKDFMNFIQSFFKKISKIDSVSFKQKKTITGKRFLMILDESILSYKIFINLDFSFRENVLDPKKSIIVSEYPVIFTSYVFHLSREEIFAEKIRALLTREQGRDLYDLWYLLNQNTQIKKNLIQEKLYYYNVRNISKQTILERIKQFSKKDFVLDMRPFVPVNEREKLSDFFDYILDFVHEKLEDF